MEPASQVDELPLGPWDVSNHDYHADRRYESSSTLIAFLQDREAYHATYVAGTLPRDEPSSAMKIGTVAHAIVFDQLDDFELLPPGPYTTKAAREARDECIAANPTRLCVTQDEYDTGLSISAAVLTNPIAADLLGKITIEAKEVSFRWRDTATDIALKSRFDALDTGETPFIPDLKTSRRPDDRSFDDHWERTMAASRYYIQAELYCRAARLMLDVPKVRHVSIVVYNTPPHTVFVRETRLEFLELGAIHLRAILRAMSRCRETGDWTNPAAKAMRYTYPPRWIFDQDLNL